MREIAEAEQGKCAKTHQNDCKPTLAWLGSLAILPALTALLSFQTNGNFAVWQMVLRQFWLPSQVFEIITILLAFLSGFSLLNLSKKIDQPVLILVLIWLGSVVIATLFSARPETATLSIVSWLLNGLFAASAAFLFGNWQSSFAPLWQRTFATLMPIGSAVFAGIILLFVFVVGIDMPYDWVSLLPGFPHIRHSGYFLLPAMALSVGMIATTNLRLRILHICLLTLNLGFAIWIGSRGPAGTFILVLMAAIGVFQKLRTIPVLRDILLSIVAGCLMSQLVPAPSHSSFNAISRVQGGSTESVDKMSSGRTEIWRDTINSIIERPFVGHGGNQFRLEVPAALETYNHPHNSVLQFTYEWGLVGGGAMIALLLLLGMRMLKVTLNDQGRSLPFFLAATSMAAFSLIDGVFYYNLPIMLFLTFAFGLLSQREVSTSA